MTDLMILIFALMCGCTCHWKSLLFGPIHHFIPQGSAVILSDEFIECAVSSFGFFVLFDFFPEVEPLSFFPECFRLVTFAGYGLCSLGCDR